MRTSKYLLYTIKEKLINTDIISYKLMLKSGMIRKLNSGFYVWLPLGLKILQNIKKIIREEMNKIDLFEIDMPIAQSADLWKKSNRFKKYGLELIKFYDRKNKLFILSPTNEEIISKIVNNEINSYKKLPIKFFQIKTKFRDEIRPSFGVIRAREFIMKDAYSFHNNYNCLKKTYNNIYKTYIKILKKLGLFIIIKKAKSNKIGGNISHEFYILSKNNITNSFFNNKFNNIKIKKLLIINKKFYIEKLRKLKISNIIKINKKLKLFIKNIIKIIIIKSNIKKKYIAFFLPKNYKLNIFKIYKLNNINKPIIYLTKKEINNLFKKKKYSIKFLFSNINIIANYNIIKMKNFSIKFEQKNIFYYGLNWGVDLPIPYIADFNNYKNKNLFIKNNLFIKQSIEVAHIFQIGTKYSKIINKCSFNKNINMGCYGIGITRLIASIIEQNYNKNGIVWSNELAPFKILLLPINYYKFKIVNIITENIYSNLYKKKINFILDDRKIQIGSIFNDIELIGIPNLIIISNKNCKWGFIEYQNRYNNKTIFIKKEYIIKFLINKIK
ncbi:MAG: proline--tRNA ligase [Enterobacteriaceae bacterium]